jgi:hypothetical protein
MDNLVLFCKSYHNDVHRVRRLAESIARHNRERLPFHLCFPRADAPHFAPVLRDAGAQAVHDEEILERTLAAGRTRAPALPPNDLQQVVKAEFWRLGRCRHFVLIDSDAWFIRDFGRADFLWDDDTPYTVMNEGRHVLDFAARTGNDKIQRQFRALRERGRALFGRAGRLYDFAPTPCVYACRVWEALYETVARPRGQNFQDQILEYPCETQWYGEFLLAHRTIPLIPVEPLFKCWHYREQYAESVRLGETEAVLARNYLGIVQQSNWHHDLDRVPRKRRSWRTLWLKR